MRSSNSRFYTFDQISEDIPSQVAKIQEEIKNRNGGPTYSDSAFNGLNTCFLTVTTPATANEEETDIWRVPVAPVPVCQ